MSLKEVDLGGGESVYCINETQLKRAFELAERDPESGPKIHALIDRIENDFTRNERAALAFVMIHRLLGKGRKIEPASVS